MLHNLHAFACIEEMDAGFDVISKESDELFLVSEALRGRIHP